MEYLTKEELSEPRIRRDPFIKVPLFQLPPGLQEKHREIEDTKALLHRLQREFNEAIFDRLNCNV